MTEEEKVYVDGDPDSPFPIDSAPDLGSLVAYQETAQGWFNPETKTTEYHQRRDYFGLSADKDKLPKYENLATGSSCFFVDTGELCFYSHTDKEWIDQ